MGKKDNILKDSFITQTHGYVDVSNNRDIWREFANEVEGKFKIIHTIDRVIEKLKIVFTDNNISYEFIESGTKPLKCIFTLPTTQKIHFLLSPNGAIDKFFANLTGNLICTSNNNFDKKYILKGKPTNIINEIFSKSELNTSILDKSIYSIIGEYKKKTKSLTITILIGRGTKSVERLRELQSLCILLAEEIVSSIEKI
ncbi:MAG: hypothetical protein JXR53_08015 [Bacteroidales bacterium]|nr:hypothetical protein [Bacteroidales bacterium]